MKPIAAETFKYSVTIFLYPCQNGGSVTSAMYADDINRNGWILTVSDKSSRRCSSESQAQIVD